MYYVAVTLHITPCNMALDIDIPWGVPLPLFLEHPDGLEASIRRTNAACLERILIHKTRGMRWQLGKQISRRFYPIWTHTLRGAGVYDGQHLIARLYIAEWDPYQYWLEAVDLSLHGERIYLGASEMIFGRVPIKSAQEMEGGARPADVNLAALVPAMTNRISRHHFRILRQPSGFYIQDLGSRNGTFVNGRPLSQKPRHPSPVVPLQLGDEILVSRRLRLVLRATVQPRMSTSAAPAAQKEDAS